MPHPQHFQPTPTVESLDSEGIVQMDPETSERVLDEPDCWPYDDDPFCCDRCWS